MSEEEPKSKNARLEAVLFDFIEPIILLLKSGKSFFISSALPSESGYVKKYLTVSVTPKILKRYFREEVDLRYVFSLAPNRQYYVLGATELNHDKLKMLEYSDEVTEEMLPAPHFFSSSHTSLYWELQGGNGALETLYIDGNWEMEDFGLFSRSYRDIYAFDQCLKILDSPAASAGKKEKIIAAFNGHSLNGGGSYVNLFSDLLATIPANDRYDLKKVKYASPGEIELQGKGDVFDAIEARIKHQISNISVLHEKYWSLRDYMSAANLLDITGSPPNVTPEVYAEVSKRSKALYEGMDPNLYSRINGLTESDVVNTAKIGMAIYRRIKSAAKYFMEGRIAFDR